MNSFFDPAEGWRRESFYGITPSDPGSRLSATLSQVSGYERIGLNAGAAMTLPEQGVAWIKPLYGPDGRTRLQWNGTWNLTLGMRWNTSTTPALNSGLAAFLAIGDFSTTLTGKEFAGGGVIWDSTTSTQILRRIVGGATTAAGGGVAGTGVATEWTFGLTRHTVANRRRISGIFGSLLDSSAQRAGAGHEQAGLAELPTGDVSIALVLMGFAVLGAEETIDVECCVNFGGNSTPLAPCVQ